MHLRAVHGDDADADKPGLWAQPQHLAEQLGQRGLVALAKARDRRLAQITRVATSSTQRRSIRRDERSPTQYAYSNNATIICGSCAGRPPPSAR